MIFPAAENVHVWILQLAFWQIKKPNADFSNYTNKCSINMLRIVSGIRRRTCRWRCVEVTGSVYFCLQVYLPNSIRSATPHHLTKTSKSLSVCVLVLIRAVSRGNVCVALTYVCLYAVLGVRGLKITRKSHGSNPRLSGSIKSALLQQLTLTDDSWLWRLGANGKIKSITAWQGDLEIFETFPVILEQ